MASKTPAKKAPAKKAPATESKPKSPARSQNSPNLEVRAEAIPLPVDESHEALERERVELHKPGRVSKADAEQIDNDPGYNKDQLAHMREYWGIDPSESATEAEQGVVVEELV